MPSLKVITGLICGSIAIGSFGFFLGVNQINPKLADFSTSGTVIVLNTSDGNVSIPDKKTGGKIELPKNTGWLLGKMVIINPSKFKIGGLTEIPEKAPISHKGI